jgi:hypothetical protein
MWIQLLLLLGIVGTILPLTRRASGARHQAIRRLLLVGFVLLAGFAILFPAWFTAVANALGVGRGTDLLLYLLVIAFLAFVANTYRHQVALNRKITVLTRKLALTEAEVSAQEPGTRERAAEDAPDAPRASGER